MTQSRSRTNKSTPEGMIAFDPEIHDVTGYEKVDIIKLRNKAFKGNGKYAKRVKGILNRHPIWSSTYYSTNQLNRAVRPPCSSYRQVREQ